MAVNGQWCLIESDPGVFSELIREFGMLYIYILGNMGFLVYIYWDIMGSLVTTLFFLGCKGLQVEELWSLD